MQLINEEDDLPSLSCTSLRTAFRRSSNSPGTSPRDERSHVELDDPLALDPFRYIARMIRWASPSAMAVLPTPGSPIKTGLFLVRRERT
jgi:hypothetical protein